jgi:peroxiredoxin
MSVSTGFRLGDPVPAFSLPDTEGTEHAVPLAAAPPATVIVATCNHCPYVVAWNPRLRAVAEDYLPRGVRFLAVNGNDAERYPADSLEHMRRFVTDQRWPIPYLHDETQEALRALAAERTPTVYVLDGDQRLAYVGAPDADYEDPAQDAAWLRAALDAVLAGRPVERPETPARGCSVKWR